MTLLAWGRLPGDASAEDEPLVVAEAHAPVPEQTVCPAPSAPAYERPDEEAIETLAKVMWAEARGISDDAEVAAVGWTAANRVAAGLARDIVDARTSPGQYAYYDDSPVTDRLAWLAEDVLTRWARERAGETDVGRVLPKEYMWFGGDGEHNHFRNQYRGGERWDWSLPSPYES